MLAKIKVLCLVTSLLMAFALKAQPRVDLGEGSLFILGALTVNYGIIDFNKNEQTLKLKSDVGGGYFVRDNLAVGFALPVGWQMLQNKFSLGFKPFATYFFDLGTTVFPYIGGNITAGYSTLTTFGTGEFQLLAGIDSGILFSLSENVALDFGLRPEIAIKLSNNQRWRLDIPGGFIGVRAFF